MTPTYSNPIKYDENCIFYEDRLIMDSDTFYYDNAIFIFYERSVDRVTGYKMKDQLYFKWFDIPERIDVLNIDGEYPIDGMANFEYKKGVLPTFKKNGKVLENLYQYITKYTFDRRMKLYINTFKKYNKINIFDIVIHNNGDLYDEEVFQGNIVDKYKNGLLKWGESYGSYKNNVTDPYYFGFEKGKKLFGLVSDNFEIRNNCNKDVFDKIISRLITHGRVI